MTHPMTIAAVWSWCVFWVEDVVGDAEPDGFVVVAVAVVDETDDAFAVVDANDETDARDILADKRGLG